MEDEGQMKNDMKEIWCL